MQNLLADRMEALSGSENHSPSIGYQIPKKSETFDSDTNNPGTPPHPQGGYVETKGGFFSRKYWVFFKYFFVFFLENQEYFKEVALPDPPLRVALPDPPLRDPCSAG